MPGMSWFSAVADATMTESPTAVTCWPDTFCCLVPPGHVLAAACDADGLADGAGAAPAGTVNTDGPVKVEGPADPEDALACDSALICWPSATCCISPEEAAEAGRVTP